MKLSFWLRIKVMHFFSRVSSLSFGIANSLANNETEEYAEKQLLKCIFPNTTNTQPKEEEQ